MVQSEVSGTLLTRARSGTLALGRWEGGLMSAGKKFPGEELSSEHSSEQRDTAVGKVAGFGQPEDGETDMKAGGSGEGSPPGPGKDPGRPRGRNQDVLPEILGKQLRAAYGELLNSPVPDAFNELIKRLESQEPRADKAATGKPAPSEESSS